MKICYLILCKKNAEQVAALVDQLDDEEVYFCIHVDKNSEISIPPRKRNIFIAEDDDRVAIRWGDMGIVTATLKLMSIALQNGTFDYIALLSGQDFPIKSNAYIKDFLQLHSGANYIDISTESDSYYKRMLKRVALYYPKWMLSGSFFAKAAKKLYCVITGGWNHTFRLFRRELPCGLTFAYGSSWWVLTGESVKWMLSFVKDHGEIRAFFDSTLVPDECFFQMLFLSSPYVGTNEENLTYVEWEDNRNHPRVFRKADIPMLLEKPQLFARKFDVNVDANAIKELSDAFNHRPAR